MTDDQFTHDPTQSRNVPGDTLQSFEQAKAAVEEGGGDGLGFVVTRHDPFLVVEVGNGRKEERLAPAVEPILSAFGETFTEADDDGLIRLFYEGTLPGSLHGGGPVVVMVGGENQKHGFRLFDSGWTPVTGRHISGTPTEPNPIDDDALREFLSQAEKL